MYQPLEHDVGMTLLMIDFQSFAANEKGVDDIKMTYL